jgi:hypothetical protein
VAILAVGITPPTVSVENVGVSLTMHKPSSPQKAEPKGQPSRLEPLADKGPKFELFDFGHLGNDRQRVARARRYDQKR